MILSNLQAIVQRPKKRLGRGHGSGKVKTAGRGTGTKARDVRQGRKRQLYQTLAASPWKRQQSTKRESIPISVSVLNSLPVSTTVTLATLLKYHMIKKASHGKALERGFQTKLKVCVPCSQSARKVIESRRIREA